LAVCLIALGLAQRDGAAVAAGLGLALLICIVSVGLLYGGCWLFAEPSAARQGPGAASLIPYRALRAPWRLFFRLGKGPVHVNRVLQAMRADGLIELKGERPNIPDWDRLKEAGDFDPTYLHLKHEEAA
jgi:hypothetical protein